MLKGGALLLLSTRDPDTITSQSNVRYAIFCTKMNYLVLALILVLASCKPSRMPNMGSFPRTPGLESRAMRANTVPKVHRNATSEDDKTSVSGRKRLVVVQFLHLTYTRPYQRREPSPRV